MLQGNFSRGKSHARNALEGGGNVQAMQIFFLSKLALLFFLANEEPCDKDKELPHLAIGGVMHDPKDPKPSTIDLSK